MLITETLRYDHKNALALFKSYEDSKDSEVLEKLCQELSQHMKLEEEIVYPAFRQLNIEGLDHSVEEHNEARELIDKLLAGTYIPTNFKRLKSAIKHHVKEEEKNIFPNVEESVGRDVLEGLAADYDFRRHSA